MSNKLINMNNYNIIFFNVESKTEDNGTYEVMNTCKTDGNKFYPVSTDSKRFELYNNINNVFVGWDNEKEFRELRLKAKYLDLSKTYTSIILGTKPHEDIRSLTELKIKEGIKILHDTIAMAKIDQKYNITDKVFALMETTGIGDPNSVYYPTSCLESYIAKNKIHISSNNDNTNKGYNLGGLNIIGENKRYENLKHFDVKSMYPNILISLQASSNLDYLNLKCSTVKELTGEWELVNETKETAFYMQKNGLKQARFKNDEYKILELDSKFDLTEANNDIANLFKDLLQYKENNTGNLRIAYKKLVNGLYGALYSDEHFKYSHINLTAIATFIGRYILYNCYKEFNGVYAKTDSIWTTNKNITEEDLNNYSNDLLNNIGIPNSCISWELESEPDKLLIKDSNKYVEVIGDEYDFKGGCEAPIQEIALKKAIHGGRVNPNNLFNEYKDQIILFCRHIKYSSKKSKELQYNPVIAKIKGYTVESDKKVFNYFSIYGYVNGLEYDEFNLEVNSYYGTSLINQILYDYGFTNKSIPFKTAEAEKEYNKPKYVPAFLLTDENGKTRPVPDRTRLNELFKTKGNRFPIIDRLQKLVLPYNSDYEYMNIILGTNYYAIDIDKKDFKDRLDNVKKELLKLFNVHQYILQSTKSGEYHIIFKTDNDLTGFEESSTVKGYEGLELKKNAPLPFNCYKYKVINYDRGFNNNENAALANLQPFNKTNKLKRFYGYDETKKTKEIIPVNDNVKDFQELDKLNSQLVELSKLVKNNRHEYCKSIGASLKGHISKNDIIFIATALDPIIDSTNVKNTITWAYDTAKPTKSLGHLNNYIKKSNNQKELKKVFKMIEETLKNNESNKELDDVSPSDIFINEVYDFYESNILDIIQFYIDSRSTGILSRKMQDAYLQSRGLEFDDLSNTLKEIIRTCRISKDYIYVNLAKHLKQLGFDRRSLTGDIYKFTDKTGWQYIPKDEFNTFLNNKFGENITDLDINKTLDCLNTLPKPQYNIVQFLNGQYNMETHEFKETDKDTFTLLNIPYEYNAEAKPTLICEFLNKSLPNYELKQIFEVIGYLFTSGNERQIMVWLTSTGGGGKSVLSNILRAIFHNQTCAVDLAGMERFDLTEFTHSHLNICSEIDNKATAKAKHYKNLTGNDSIKVEKKHQDPFTLPKEEVPKNIQVCNNMPNFDTLDNPLLQRFLIIEFKHQFRGTDEQIKGLDDKIIESKEDMEWLIYQSLQAHKTMCKENKDFAIRLSEEETRKRVVANNNPLIPAIDALVDFNDEFGIMKTSSYIMADEFKEILDMWIKENGLNVIHDKTGTINNKAIINSIKTNFDIWDETWRVKDDDIKELHYTTNRKTVNGKQQRVFPFLEKTEEYKELEAKWQAPKLSGKQNKKHTENPIKENKPHELAYIESEDNPNQPQQKELI